MNTDLGQHVLKNPGVADAIVNKADLKQSDVVLGIHSALNTRNDVLFSNSLSQHKKSGQGQVCFAFLLLSHLRSKVTVKLIGIGNLTVRILEKAKRCIAIEADARMAAETTKRVQGTPAQKRLDILLGDAIKTTFPPVDVVISNTP